MVEVIQLDLDVVDSLDLFSRDLAMGAVTAALLLDAVHDEGGEDDELLDLRHQQACLLQSLDFTLVLHLYTIS